MYRQVQIEDELAQIYREKEKIIIVVYGEEKQMLKFKAVPNKKKYR